MVRFCCVKNCESFSSFDSVSFHQFPAGKTALDLERRRLWMEAIQRSSINVKYAKICGLHFVTGKPAKFNENNAPNWIPTLNLGASAPNRSSSSIFSVMDLNNNRVVLPVEPPTHLLCSPMDQECFGDEVLAYEEVCGEDGDVMDTSAVDDVRVEGAFEESLAEILCSEAELPFAGPETNNNLAEMFEPPAQLLCSSLEHKQELQNSVCDENEHPAGEYDFDIDMCEEWLDDDTASTLKQENLPTSSSGDPPGNKANGERGQNVSELIKKFEAIIRKKEEEVKDLKSIVSNQQQILESLQYDLKFLENNDKKTCHFTGIPTFSTLTILYGFVHKAILPASAILSKQQIFVMVLMRLRLNLSFKTLGYLYRVSVTTACKYFYSGLYSMYQQLKGLIKWPSKELLQAYSPLKFKKAFPNDVVTSIIDCYEVFTEKPGTKDTAIKMYSNYKHSYTVKILISITPFGTISFVSKPYTGRTSDKFITESCGYMDNVKENDLILADRGFTVQKAINDKKATLRVPDSSSRRQQLSAVAVESTRALASVRNEVERAIGALRGKYRILKGPIPVTMANHKHNGINVLHMVVTVSCALVNLCPSIIR